MSEAITPQDTQDKPAKVTRASNARVPFATVIARSAKRKGIDQTRAGKELRAFARREFATVSKLDPSHFGAKGKYKETANDGRPWTDVNAKTAEYLLKGKRAK